LTINWYNNICMIKWQKIRFRGINNNTVRIAPVSVLDKNPLIIICKSASLSAVKIIAVSSAYKQSSMLLDLNWKTQGRRHRGGAEGASFPSKIYQRRLCPSPLIISVISVYVSFVLFVSKISVITYYFILFRFPALKTGNFINNYIIQGIKQFFEIYISAYQTSTRVRRR